jgi:U3 small nucleolar RNA-associated protein 14
LRQSGIRDEKAITEFEDLALKKVSIDEVRQRQSQLRAMRELLFRQDQKAKRIAKIKSKSYRRIHKRERERELERLAEEDEDGEYLSNKRVKMEAARAKERMTLRHKNTGDWAKKILSRGQHNLETRQALSEQIRRGDDLQKKILGDVEESEMESDTEEELNDLLEDPNKWGEDNAVRHPPDVEKGVLGMAFMKNAMTRQNQFIDQQIAELRTLGSTEDDEDGINLTVAASDRSNPGRMIFTPGNQVLRPLSSLI